MIFIFLFDKKSRVTEDQKRQLEGVVEKSTLYFTKEIPIYWGDYSLVEAELELFTTALKIMITVCITCCLGWMRL